MWMLLAISAQILSALTVFIDKYVLVSKQGLKHPVAFAFYTALLSGAVVVLLPFGVVSLPTFEIAFLTLIAALCYVGSLIFLYYAYEHLSVTDVIPITAAAGAIATGVLAAVFLSGDLPLNLIPAYGLMLLGTIFVYCFCFPISLLSTTVLSGLLLGSSTFIAKLVFEASSGDFWTALFWQLFMNVVVAVVLLLPARWHSIKTAFSGSSHGVKWLAVLSKSLGGFAFFLTFLAISMGSVSIVNAMGGLQLVFLLVFVPLFIKGVPSIFKHEFMPGTHTLKIAGTVCIVLGLAALFLI